MAIKNYIGRAFLLKWILITGKLRLIGARPLHFLGPAILWFAGNWEMNLRANHTQLNLIKMRKGPLERELFVASFEAAGTGKLSDLGGSGERTPRRRPERPLGKAIRGGAHMPRTSRMVQIAGITRTENASERWAAIEGTAGADEIVCLAVFFVVLGKSKSVFLRRFR